MPSRTRVSGPFLADRLPLLMELGMELGCLRSHSKPLAQHAFPVAVRRRVPGPTRAVPRALQLSYTSPTPRGSSSRFLGGQRLSSVPSQALRGSRAPLRLLTVSLHSAVPPSSGLFNAQDSFKDACGVGFVGELSGVGNRRTIVDALEMLRRMAHRGACGCEAATGVLADLLRLRDMHMGPGRR